MTRIYLDRIAATPLRPEVLEAMRPFLGESFGNPQSLHAAGREALAAVDAAREEVAALIGATAGEITFTATLGPVDRDGRADPGRVEQALTKETILVSVMTANSEVGTIQPVAEIAAVCRGRKIPFHTDAVAAAGSVPIDVKALGVDALSLAGDQFYGPKGSAALFVRKGVRLLPLIDGGIQEGGRRGGTENVPAIVGLGRAAALARAEMASRAAALAPLRT